MKENDYSEKQQERRWTPNTPGSKDALKNEQRSLDIGESGQFAPGGYYNQHGVAESERLDLDEYTATRTPDDKTGS